MPEIASVSGPMELLILQSTPFCNIACDYCYLPNRSDRRSMSREVLEAVASKVLSGPLPAAALTVVWHAGEPLVLKPAYYREAFEILERYRPPHVSITHNFQTNGTLIDEAWCELLAADNVRVGLSIDGPDWLHDKRRKTRAGKGTHATVTKGAALLKDHGVPFHVICVLTAESLQHPDAIFDYFTALKPSMLCFNVEEVEGINVSSSLAGAEMEAGFRAFFKRILDRYRAEPCAFRIREIEDVLMALRHPQFGRLETNAQNDPFRIVSIACDGAFSTFSPELLGTAHLTYGPFEFGNVMSDPPLYDQLTPRYERVLDDVRAGISRCKVSCKYFDFCRGGAPANKLAETGTFDATETMFCRLTQKAVIDVVLAELDTSLRQQTAGARLM